MKYPALPQDKSYRISVPLLNGGINTRVANTQIEDNQLSYSSNVWWKDGALRTRLGIEVNIQDIQETYPMDFTNDDSIHYLAPEYRYVGTLFYDGGRYAEWSADIYTYMYSGSEYGGSECYAKLFYADGKIKNVGSNPAWSVIFAKPGLFIPSSVEIKSKAYYIRPDRFIQELTNEWSNPYEVSPYIPLVLVNGRGFAATSAGNVSGQFYEGYNILTSGFRSQYTTDATARYFFLPRKNIAGSVTVSYTAADGNVLKFEIDENADYSSTVSSLIARIHRSGGYIYFTNTSSTVQALPSAGVNNNIEITAFSERFNFEGEAEYKPNTISGMKFSTWFGGSRGGLNSGTRLFVSGNPDYPNLIHWSDLNNPLYFPENNYAYVGDSSQRITAFGKQNDMLVIFKEHEIFAANYVANNITTEDITDNNIIDIASSAAVFPITQIHAAVGCDCPRTIQLCANRLVWATSQGKIYTLVGTNQNSERNIFELSLTISNELKTLINSLNLLTACACDWQNYYMLVAGDKAFLLDYDSNSFAYITSYSDTERAQNALSWYIWEFKNIGDVTHVVSDGNNCSLVSDLMISDIRYRMIIKFTGTKDITAAGGEPERIENLKSINGNSNINIIGHGLNIGDVLRFSGNVPSPIFISPAMPESTRYYVVEATETYFKVSDSINGAPIVFNETINSGWIAYRYGDFSTESKDISSEIQTKVFEFNNSENYKFINTVHLGIHRDVKNEMSVSYITDKGITDDAYVNRALTDNDTVQMVRFTPRLNRITRFGIKLKCTGTFSFEQMVIKYTARGGSVR